MDKSIDFVSIATAVLCQRGSRNECLALSTELIREVYVIWPQ